MMLITYNKKVSALAARIGRRGSGFTLYVKGGVLLAALYYETDPIHDSGIPDIDFFSLYPCLLYTSRCV